MATDFSQGKVWKNIIFQAIPLTLAQLVQLLYNVVDRVYIGHLPGAENMALTGIGLTFPVITLIAAFTNLFGSGGTPLFSISRGKGEEEEAEKIMGNVFSLILRASLFLFLFCYLLRRPILFLFGASEGSYVYADEYLKIYLFGNLFVMIGLGMNPFINSQGFGKIGMITVTLGAVINILLDPLFIFVFHMGVRGAALATVIAQFGSAVWVLCFLFSDKPILRLRLKWEAPDWPVVRQIMTLGVSGFIMNFTNSVVQVVCNRQLQFYGGDLYVGVMTVLNSVRDVSTMGIQGIANGAQPVISFNYGAGKKERVKQGIRFMTVVCIIYTCVVWMVTLTFPGPLIRMFNSESKLVAAGIPAMHIYFFGFCFMALQFSGQSTFQALGEAKYAITFSIFRKIVIVVPLTFLLPMIPGIGLFGVFLAEPISNVVGGCASFFTMLFVVWHKRLGLAGGKE